MSIFKRKKNRNLTKSPGQKSAFKAYLSEASKKRSATSPRINARDENIRIEITKRVFIAFADKSSLLKDFGNCFSFRWIYITIDGARLSSDFRRRNNFLAMPNERNPCKQKNAEFMPDRNKFRVSAIYNFLSTGITPLPIAFRSRRKLRPPRKARTCCEA